MDSRFLGNDKALLSFGNELLLDVRMPKHSLYKK
jgi:hypothetical protein